jgi:hypothetical protein
MARRRKLPPERVRALGVSRITPAQAAARRRRREAKVRRCRECGCTERDCRACYERTGKPCSWVAADLCSACVEE